MQRQLSLSTKVDTTEKLTARYIVKEETEMKEEEATQKASDSCETRVRPNPTRTSSSHHKKTQFFKLEALQSLFLTPFTRVRVYIHY